jgi:uncharacterized protein (TIGR03437 family)
MRLRIPAVLLVTAMAATAYAAQVVTVAKLATFPNPSVQGSNVVITVSAQQQGQTPSDSPPAATGSINVNATCPNGLTSTLGIVAPLDKSGAGTLSVSNWPCTGAITLVAAYSGDSNYMPAFSAPLVQTVNAQFAPTTTTVNATPTSANLGEPITLSATLSFITINNSAPTGKVNFVDASKGTVLGTGIVQTTGAGRESVTSASMSTSSLAAGSNMIQAAYLGDNIYAPSTSATLTVIVGVRTPSIARVVTTAGNQASQNQVIAQNTWIEIHGDNLSSSSQDWSGQDFSKGLPLSLAGVSATVNNVPAAIYYVSPGQVNILTPLDNSAGPVPIQVTTPAGKTSLVMPTMLPASPSFLAMDAAGHVAARHSDYSLAGPASSSAAGYTFTPVKPGEVVLLYAVGFGQTSPPITDQLRGVGFLSTMPAVTIGGLPGTVQAAGISVPGLYQLNVVVPASAPDGDLALAALYNGVSTQAGIVLTVQH